MQNWKDKYEPKKLDVVGEPKSNWRYKVYPKPTIWVSKETLKGIKTKKNKRNGFK